MFQLQTKLNYDQFVSALKAYEASIAQWSETVSNKFINKLGILLLSAIIAIYSLCIDHL
jgi:hypothetical protein